MKSGRRYIIFFSLLILLSVTFALTNQYLAEILTYFSPKFEVKPHFIDKVRKELLLLYIITVIILFAFSFLSNYLKKYLLSNPEFYNKIGSNTKQLEKVILVFVAVYIFIAPIFILYSLDIGTDESTYAYTGYHYYHFDKFMIKLDNDSFIIPKDMYLQNVPLVLLKPFVPYSIDVMRYITYFYSMLFVLLLYFFFKKNYGALNSKIFLIVIASYSGFTFLSGTSFGENSALLFALAAVYLFSEYYDSNKLIGLHLAAMLLSLSIITKIQLGIFLIPSLMFFAIAYYLKNKDFRQILYLLLEVLAFSVFFVAVLWITNYSFKDFKSLVAIYYSVSVNSMTYTETWVSILMNLERFFNYHMLLFLPVVFYYFINRKYEKSFIEKYFLTVFALNAIWFITMKGYNFRFMYFAQIGIMLLSIKPIALYYEKCSVEIKKTIKLVFALILIVGIIHNIKMTVNGVSNDYLFSLNGNNPLKTFYKFNHNDDQKEFYDKVKSVIDSSEPVYYVGAEFEVMAFIPNKFYTFNVETYNPQLNVRYIIRTSINDQLDINTNAKDFLSSKCDKVFEKGLYCLYKIK